MARNSLLSTTRRKMQGFCPILHWKRRKAKEGERWGKSNTYFDHLFTFPFYTCFCDSCTWIFPSLFITHSFIHSFILLHDNPDPERGKVETETSWSKFTPLDNLKIHRNTSFILHFNSCIQCPCPVSSFPHKNSKRKSDERKTERKREQSEFGKI